MTNELSTERAIEALFTVRAYYASLTVGYPKGKDRRGIGDVMCSEIANSCLMAIEALEQKTCEDCISREEAIKACYGMVRCTGIDEVPYEYARDVLSDLPSVTPQPKTRWIPVSERLPEDLEPVNIIWVNHEPEPYYHDIKDRNFVATGIYYRGQWYWYSTTCADYLGEYGSNEIDKVDDAVEIIAWMPLPEPYQGGENDAKQ